MGVSLVSPVGLTPRAYWRVSTSASWELIWDAAAYYEHVVVAASAAREFVVFVGWQLDSRLVLTRQGSETLRQFVIRLCREKPQLHVYLLMWDHAYFYVLEREWVQGLRWSGLHERVHFLFDNRHPYGGSHHEKLVLADGEEAFVGSIDICDDRWDSPCHFFRDPGRSLKHDRDDHGPYHDMGVRVRGQVVADLLTNVGTRWRSLTNMPFPRVGTRAEERHPAEASFEGARPPSSVGLSARLVPGSEKFRVLLSRTLAPVDGPLIRETEHLYRQLIRSTRRQLIIENQYLWSQDVGDELIWLMRERREALRILLVLPAPFSKSKAFRMMGVRQTALVERLEAVARETGTRLVLGCPYSRDLTTGREGSVYVHSKLMVVDDRFAAVGSCNFNNRGFRLDTEMTLTLIGDSEPARAVVTECARRVAAHWGVGTYGDVFGPGEPAPRDAPHHLYLKPYHAAWAAYLRSREADVARRYPVESFFDPRTPLVYLWKRRIGLALAHPSGRLKKLLPVAHAVGVVALAALGLLASAVVFEAIRWGFSVDWRPQTPMLFAFLGAVFTAGAMSHGVPLWIGGVVLGLFLGPEAGAVLAACSIWTMLWACFWLARSFPRLLPARVKPAGPLGRQPPRLEIRSISGQLAVAALQAGAIPSMIALEGLFAIPVRWFLVASASQAALQAAVAVAAGICAGALSR